jgi:hypothetical protein
MYHFPVEKCNEGGMINDQRVTHQGTNVQSRPASIDKTFEPDSGGCSSVRTAPEYSSDHLGDAQPMADDNDMIPESAFDVHLSIILPWATIHHHLDLPPIHIHIRIRIRGTGTGMVVRGGGGGGARVIQMRPHKPLHGILRPKREVVKRLATSEPIVPIPYRLVHLGLGLVLGIQQLPVVVVCWRRWRRRTAQYYRLMHADAAAAVAAASFSIPAQRTSACPRRYQSAAHGSVA